jgi:hypothetical protein
MKVSTGTTVFTGLAIGVVVVAVVGGLIVLGPPSEERTRRLDERRTEDLRGITRAVDLYWTRHGRLPASIKDLSGESGLKVSARDPGTAQTYELRVLDTATYELCASFERMSTEPGNLTGRTPDVSEDFWSHGVGRRCFRLDAQEVPAREKRQR